jgi:hypothetical protein
MRVHQDQFHYHVWLLEEKNIHVLMNDFEILP